MAERIVKWTRTADIQYVGILEYWVNHNKSSSYSKKLIKLVSKRTKQIAKTPYIYRSTDLHNIRVSTLGHFNIYYKVYDEMILITALWDSRQNPDKLLQILKNEI